MNSNIALAERIASAISEHFNIYGNINDIYSLNGIYLDLIGKNFGVYRKQVPKSEASRQYLFEKVLYESMYGDIEVFKNFCLKYYNEYSNKEDMIEKFIKDLREEQIIFKQQLYELSIKELFCESDQTYRNRLESVIYSTSKKQTIGYAINKFNETYDMNISLVSLLSYDDEKFIKTISRYLHLYDNRIAGNNKKEIIEFSNFNPQTGIINNTISVNKTIPIGPTDGSIIIDTDVVSINSINGVTISLSPVSTKLYDRKRVLKNISYVSGTIAINDEDITDIIFFNNNIYSESYILSNKDNIQTNNLDSFHITSSFKVDLSSRYSGTTVEKINSFISEFDIPDMYSILIINNSLYEVLNIEQANNTSENIYEEYIKDHMLYYSNNIINDGEYNIGNAVYYITSEYKYDNEYKSIVIYNVEYLSGTNTLQLINNYVNENANIEMSIPLIISNNNGDLTINFSSDRPIAISNTNILSNINGDIVDNSIYDENINAYVQMSNITNNVSISYEKESSNYIKYNLLLSNIDLFTIKYVLNDNTEVYKYISNGDDIPVIYGMKVLTIYVYNIDEMEIISDTYYISDIDKYSSIKLLNNSYFTVYTGTSKKNSNDVEFLSDAFYSISNIEPTIYANTVIQNGNNIEVEEYVDGVLVSEKLYFNKEKNIDIHINNVCGQSIPILLFDNSILIPSSFTQTENGNNYIFKDIVFYNAKNSFLYAIIDPINNIEFIEKESNICIYDNRMIPDMLIFMTNSNKLDISNTSNYDIKSIEVIDNETRSIYTIENLYNRQTASITLEGYSNTRFFRFNIIDMANQAYYFYSTIEYGKYNVYDNVYISDVVACDNNTIYSYYDSILKIYLDDGRIVFLEIKQNTSMRIPSNCSKIVNGDDEIYLKAPRAIFYSSGEIIGDISYPIYAIYDSGDSYECISNDDIARTIFLAKKYIDRNKNEYVIFFIGGDS